MNLSLEALQIVDMIARRGSFAAAAAELGKVPSALSYTVRRPEEDLDVLVFDRLRAMIDDFRRLGSPTRLRIGHEVLEGCWDALLDGRAELALGAMHDAPADISASGQFTHRPLGERRFVFCVAPHHPLAASVGPLAREARLAHRAVALAGTARNRPARTLGLLGGQDLLTVATMEQKVEDPRPPEALRYAWRCAARGKALSWWLSRLEVARVRKMLIAGPAAANLTPPLA